MLKERDGCISDDCAFVCLAQIFIFIITVVEAVHEEIKQIRHNSFSTFRFQQINQMVVGRWKELYKDLSNDTNSWLLDVKKRESIEVMYDSIDILFKSCCASCFFQCLFTDFFPFLMDRICRSRFFLVWSCMVKTTHEDITIDKCLNCPFCKL